MLEMRKYCPNPNPNPTHLLSIATSMYVHDSDRGHRRRRKTPTRRTFDITDGAILGTGVLASKMLLSDSWPWKDELVDGVPSVGAVSPVTITVLSDNVKVSGSLSLSLLHGLIVTFSLWRATTFFCDFF